MARKIDIHGHLVLTEALERGQDLGVEEVVDGEGRRMLRVGAYQGRATSTLRVGQGTKQTPAQRVETMDDLGIDVMGLTISPLLYLYGSGAAGIEYSQAQNEALAAYCAHAPDRFFWIPTIPVQDVGASVAELERAWAAGGRGVNIGTDNLAGRELDDPELDPIFEALAASGTAMFLHPAPSGIASQADQPDRYNLQWLVGYLYQETLAAARLIYGGVLDRHPDLKVYIPHGGGMLPFQFGRLDYGATRMLDVVAAKEPRHYLQNFFFDICIHDPASRAFLVDFAGPDHLVVGSNFGGWDQVNGFEFTAQMDLSQRDRELIEGGTAEQLFRLA